MPVAIVIVITGTERQLVLAAGDTAAAACLQLPGPLSVTVAVFCLTASRLSIMQILVKASNNGERQLAGRRHRLAMSYLLPMHATAI